MKKINNNEEFSAAGRIWMFDDTSDKVVLKNLRAAGKSKPSFIPPTIEDVKAFFKLEGYKEEIAIKAFNHYDRGNWHNSKGKPVLNWKQTMGTNWMTEDNKIKELPKGQVKDKFMF